ncbi:MAG: glycosyltransferase [Bacteroidota bacterium]|nr:glycosyltransferase [Bacteroidota bacterium]
MKAKIYITDEGFGPVVRQSAIVEAMLALQPDFETIIQTNRHAEEVERSIKHKALVNKHNLITWRKTDEGFPDVDGIKSDFSDYLTRSDEWMKGEDIADVDFVISDFVYEAFYVAQKYKKPAFGIAHFTWDWFFSKLYPLPLKQQVLNRFFEYAELSDVLYFPPFTPQEILKYYNKKAKQVPFIIRKINAENIVSSGTKIKILFIDSGSGVLKTTIQKALMQIKDLKEYEIYISETFNVEAENVIKIRKNEFFIDYIGKVDLVIGRAGFNTISECIAYRTPMLLLSEAMNPEMNENIINVKHEGIGSFISLHQFTTNLPSFLSRFFNAEYKTIKENMQEHTYPLNGASVIAEDILNRMKK